MFSLATFNLFNISIESERQNDPVGMMATRSAEESGPPQHLAVPWWPEDPDRKDIFDLLNWRAKLTEFRGRGTELDILREWCNSDKQKSIKFLVGEGGVGKTRLAAQFAEDMQGLGWEAGFVDLDEPGAFPMCEQGNLLIVDYPEESRSKVKEFLEDLAPLVDTPRLRILFLSRRSSDEWQQILYDSHASGLATEPELLLAGLDAESAYAVAHETLEKAAAALASLVLRDWPEAAPEAIWTVLGTNLEGGLERLARLSHDSEVVLGLGQPGLSHLMALAVEGNPERCEAVRSYVSTSTIPEGWREMATCTWRTVLEHASTPRNKCVALTNLCSHLAGSGQFKAAIDVAVVAIEMLDGDEETAASEDNPRFDIALLLNNLSGALSEMGDWKSAKPLSERSVNTFRRIIAAGTDNVAGFLGSALYNLAVALSGLGETQAAIEVCQESVQIYRQLAEKGSSELQNLLAMSLNVISVLHSDCGDKIQALRSIEEAVEIRRRLSELDAARYFSHLAYSLNNLSAALRFLERRSEALVPLIECNEGFRKLADVNPSRFKSRHALTLNNLASLYAELGDLKNALECSFASIALRREIARILPSRGEQDLATSLMVLGMIQSSMGADRDALASFQESLGISERYATRTPSSRAAKLIPDLEELIRQSSTRLAH